MLNWGIIGAGNIANRFVKALELIDGARLYAVSNRTIEKANDFKQKHNAIIAYGNFDDLINDSEVDIVYIATPHIHHKEWIIKALKAGKAVLCEKPMVIYSNDIDEIIEIQTMHNVFLMEAMKTKVVPLYIELNRILKSKEYGEVLKVETSLCHVSPYQDKYHYDPIQGGCLLDLGIYNTCYLVDFLDGDYTVKIKEKTFYENGVDTYVNAVLEYSNGTIGILETAFDRKKEAYAKITTSNAVINVPMLHRPEKLEIHVDGNVETITVPYENDDFYSQIKHVCDCFIKDQKKSDIIGLESTKKAIQMIERIKGEL